MRYKASFLYALLCLLLAQQAFSQTPKNRVQPGRLYGSGEEVYSSRFGFTSKVPEGWVAALPRETEVFLLNANAGFFGEMYVFGREAIDLNRLADDWKRGVEITETLTLKAENPQVKGDMLSGDVRASGEFVDRNYRGFAATRCGEKGYCITVLAVFLEENGEKVKNAALSMLQGGVFDTPRIIDPYEGFDWTEFLSNKLLIAHDQVLGGQRQSEVTLCPSGSFFARVRKKGLFRQTNPDYRGRMSGTWQVAGEGSKAMVKLEFDKRNLSPLTFTIEFVEEQLVVDGQRFYASESRECK